MKQTHAWLLWLPLSAVSSLALAVGLGPASVNSPLDAPLNATVPVVDASQYALDELRVSVADEAAFTTLGLEWTPLASSLRVQLREQGDGRQLLLSSSQAVDDPWLDVLLTISSPEGETSQAFTLLFDPPDMRNATSASSSGQQAANTAEPRSQPVTAPATPNGPSGGSATMMNNSGYVASGDTLWGVAERLKPASASVQQMIVALVDANPGVFPAGNINSLRAGQTLTVPSREQVMARSPGEAARAVQAMRRTSEQPPTEAAEIAHAEPEQAAYDSESATDSAAPLDADQAQNPESELAGLTLNDVIEQLAESQAMLQQVLEERSQLRMELAELRQEVAALTEALNVSQQEMQATNAAATALSAGDRAAQNQGASPEPTTNERAVLEQLSDYRWPLASAALALLLAGLIWSRKRRERHWEDAPVTASAVPPPVSSASAATTGRAEPRMAEPYHADPRAPEPFDAEPASAEPVANVSAGASSTFESQGAKPNPETAAFDDAPVMKPHTAEPDADVPSVNDSKAPKEWEADDDDVFTRSQASGLAAQRQQHNLDSQEQMPLASSMAREPESVPGGTNDDTSALDALLHDGRKEGQEEGVEAATSPPDTPDVSEEDQRSQPLDYYIDYNPPSLTQEEEGDQGAVEGGSADGATTPRKKAWHSPRVPEEEWEIEEVAFEPRRRDNS